MKRIMMTAIAASALVATGALAQEEDASRGSGNVTAAEQVGGGTMPTWSDLDPDERGLLSEDEFNAANDDWNASRGAGNERGEDLVDEPAMEFGDLDTDADGNVSEDEYNEYMQSRGAGNETAAEAAGGAQVTD